MALEQLEQSRTNVAAFMLKMINLRRFKESPFVASTLRTEKYVYVRDNRLGKPALAAKYPAPFKVLQKDWDNNTFLLEMGRRQDVVALARLKTAFIPDEAR